MLPPEILTQIFQEISPRPCGPYTDLSQEWKAPVGLRTLAAVCRASQLFRDVATPILYQHLNMKAKPGKKSALLSTLLRKPELSRHIIKLRMESVGLGAGEDLLLSARTVGQILRGAGKLEQLVLDCVTIYGGDTAIFVSREDEEEACFEWTCALLPLADCPVLQSLWIERGTVPFQLPPLLSLLDLRIDHSKPGTTLSSSLPSLSTLHLIFSKLSPNQLPPISQLCLNRFTPPQFIARILSSIPTLQHFKFNLQFNDVYEEFISTFSELLSKLKSDQPGPMETMEVYIVHKTRELPSIEFIVAIRTLLYEIRSPKFVKVTLERFFKSGRSEWRNFEGLVRQGWEKEGTETEIILEQGTI